MAKNGLFDYGYDSMPLWGQNTQAPYAPGYSAGDSMGISFGVSDPLIPTSPVSAPAANSSWSWFGGTNPDGTKISSGVGAALGVAQGLGSAYMGMKQYGLAKQQLAMSKDQFNKNYEAQKTTTNASLEDRQRARVASNSGAYTSVGDYMNQNRIR